MIHEYLPLSGLIIGMITLPINIYCTDAPPLPDVVKTPAPPAGPIPIPYPNIGKSVEKPDSKVKGNEKRVDKVSDRRDI